MQVGLFPIKNTYMKLFYFLLFQIALIYSVLAQSSSYTPPENFIANRDALVETYTNESAAAVIQINKMENVDFVKFHNSFDKEQLISNGLEILTEGSNMKDDGLQYFYYTCKYTVLQEHEGQISDFMRIVYFTSAGDTLVMAVASFPMISAEILQDILINSFKNIH